MSELIDKIKNAKAELLYVSEFVGTPNERASDIERAFQPIFKHLEQPPLNENQLEVLEWLKEEQTKNPELTIFGTLSVLFDESENRFMNLDVIDALNNLSNPQQEGVFQAFSKWSLEQEEAE